MAQWVGSEKGAAALDKIEQAWPGYGTIGRASILNAYYTDPDVIATVWTWLRNNGVTAGHGWEPGCGRGDWMAMAPRGMTFDAVDVDPVSVRIAGLLTRQQVVEARIEEWDLARSSRSDVHGYDVVVGNVPFSSIRPGRNNPHRDNLHNLAVARGVEMLRPGGVMAVLTSRYALDADGSRDWRQRMATQVDLVGVFRLPANTHKEAGTAVVTDLLVLRRPMAGEARPLADWVDTVDLEVDGVRLRHNAHFAAHPERVLGRYETGGAYRAENLNVIGSERAARALHTALAPITIDYQPQGVAPQLARPAQVQTTRGRALPAGSIVVDTASDTGFSRDSAPHKCSKKGRAELSALCQLRDLALDYLDQPSDDGRAELADLYSTYRDTYGPLNRFELRMRRTTGSGGADDEETTDGEEVVLTRRDYPRLDGFRSDPSWWTVAALENFDDDRQVATPAAILRQPILDERGGDRWPASADSLTLAVANSLARFHRIDEGYVAAQLEVDLPTARDHLTTVAFELPGGGWEVADTYLAGDVVGKLEQATAAAVGNPVLRRNVEALAAALPTPLTQAEIVPELGVTWLTADDIGSFVRHLAGGSARVMYHPPTGQWSSEGWAPAGPAQYRTSRWGVLEQVVRACNAVSVAQTKTIYDQGREFKIPDPEATAEEQLARDNLNEALLEWCWAEPDRAAVLVDRYNRLYNRYQPVHYDGAHLTLPGLAVDFTPRPHQKDAIWRVLTGTDTGTLMAHGVGAGKTAAMIIAAHEARRTGRVTGTTLFAVPGNMVEQFARDYLRLYPAARVITPRDTDRDSLREFAARVATGDYDAAICSHNAVKKVPLHPHTQARQIEARIDELVTTDETATLNRRAARNMEKQIAKLREQLTALNDAAIDTTITYWDQMRVGMFFVDEAHLAKNIALNTKREGLPMPTASQLAEAILARADLVRQTNGAAAVVMATATPITNSPAEMWVAARLVAPDALHKAGLRHFDAFAANFLSPIETIEHTAGGDLKTVTRLADYRNFPDLARMFRAFTDVRRTDSLGFRLPVLDGGQARVHVVEPSDNQLAVNSWARERVQGLHLSAGDGDRRKDPVIAILGSTRDAALHPATISADTYAKWATMSHPNLTPDWTEPAPKLIEAADTIAGIYHRTAEHRYPDSTLAGAAQVVFCDRGVPNADGTPSVYSLLTDLLAERGVQRQHIAWVHQWPDPNSRQPLWDQARNGQVRVLIGSTMQMGVGVNIQPRLIAAHELTAPYRPDWLEQAEGRMIRQGNYHDRVELHRYVSERTADATSWQILERKARFIHLAMSHPDQLTRELRDESVETPAEQYAQISALATGDHRHIELAAVTGAMTRLERAERAHKAAITNQQKSIRNSDHTIATSTEAVAALQALRPQPAGEPTDIGQQLTQLRWGERTITLDGIEHHARRDDYQLTLTIPGTTMTLKIERGRLHPADGGRGLGTAVRNWHENIPKYIEDQHDRIASAQRQRDAEIARPVPNQFPRTRELLELRRRHTELSTALQAAPEPSQSDLCQTPVVAAEPRDGGPIDRVTVFSERERRDWISAFRAYHPDSPATWGNRARANDDDWATAVAEHFVDPANQHPARRTDIGLFRGVALQARADNQGIRIYPRTNCDDALFPAYTHPHGSPINIDRLERWLAQHHQQARIDRTILAAASNRAVGELGPGIAR